MQNRLGFAALLAIGTLALAPVTGGCGPSRPAAGDPDGGSNGTPDAGSIDPNDCTKNGGCDAPQTCNTTTKRCEDPPGGAVGDVCSGGTQSDPQGSCGDGLECNVLIAAIFGKGGDAAGTTCTKFCNEDAECGDNNGADNICVELPEGITPNGEFGFCAQGCNQDAACTNADDRCLVTGGDKQTCIPSCATNNECSYGYTCMAELEACNPETCPANGNCGAGRVCGTFGANKLCVDDCTTAGCPDPLVCNSTKKTCVAPGGTYYQACSQQNRCAEADATCLSGFPGATGSICLQNCTESGLCGGIPEGQDCAIQAGSSTNPSLFCILPCTTTGTPTVCPEGTVCRTLFSNSTDKYCAPPATTP